MGIVINIRAYGSWERTYFVQEMDETKAKEKAFNMFKQTMSCCLPDSLEEFETDDRTSIEVVATVEQIIL